MARVPTSAYGTGTARKDPWSFLRNFVVDRGPALTPNDFLISAKNALRVRLAACKVRQTAVS